MVIYKDNIHSRTDKTSFQEPVALCDGTARVNAEGMHYRDLNNLIKSLSNNGLKRIELSNVFGQRYLGTGLDSNIEIQVYGIPGNDLGAFMRETTIIVHGNAQDGCGNTMDNGKIVIHGHAGDVVGYSMRGGSIFIRDDVGYRVGIHMKEYLEKRPVIVVGGTAQDFLGEYMAGGILVLLGLTLRNNAKHSARFVGTGMHGGKIYVRGEVENPSNDIEVTNLDENDKCILTDIVREFCKNFGYDINTIMEEKFIKLVPISKRPYERLYVK